MSGYELWRRSSDDRCGLEPERPRRRGWTPGRRRVSHVDVAVPGSGPVTIRVEGGFGSELDLALEFGAPILDYRDGHW